ncbi:MAG: hypothetical protein IPL79_19585 [Myxococcales bacterium]|nr:hypothetical protein [Myxococcales bacterium]
MSSCASRVMALLLIVAASAGCRTPASERCREYCSRGADCAIPADNKAFDEAECVSTCAALERDVVGKKSVDTHIACMDAAKDCVAIRQCL